MPRSRAQLTTLRKCSAGSTWPVGFDGEFSQARRTRSGPKRSGCRLATGGHQPAGHRRRRSGRPARVSDNVTGAAAEQCRQPGDELLGADDRQDRGRIDAARRAAGPASPRPLPGRRRSRPWRIAGRVGGSRRAAWITAGTGSTGVPTDRSTMPPGCARARSAAGARASQGNTGSRAAYAAGSARPSASAACPRLCARSVRRLPCGLTVSAAAGSSARSPAAAARPRSGDRC